MVLLTFEQFTRKVFYSHISKVRQILAFSRFLFLFRFPLSRTFFPSLFSPWLRGKKGYARKKNNYGLTPPPPAYDYVMCFKISKYVVPIYSLSAWVQLNFSCRSSDFCSLTLPAPATGIYIIILNE